MKKKKQNKPKPFHKIYTADGKLRYCKDDPKKLHRYHWSIIKKYRHKFPVKWWPADPYVGVKYYAYDETCKKNPYRLIYEKEYKALLYNRQMLNYIWK